MYPGSRYLRQLTARASGLSDRPPSGLPAIAPLPSNSGGSDSGGVNVSLQQVVPITLGPRGLPASEDVGGGVYLDPAVLDDSGAGGITSGQTQMNSFSDEDYKGAGLGGLLTRPQDQAQLPKVRLLSLDATSILVYCC